MTLQLTKDCIDLGIVVRDAKASLAFYRDTVGLAHIEDLDVPGIGTMQRLGCGNSFVKLVSATRPPPDVSPPGGIPAATGFRYFTISVANIEEVVAACTTAGYKIAVPLRELRPGVHIAMVEDPDGNWVEFLGRS